MSTSNPTAQTESQGPAPDSIMARLSADDLDTIRPRRIFLPEDKIVGLLYDAVMSVAELAATGGGDGKPAVICKVLDSVTGISSVFRVQDLIENAEFILGTFDQTQSSCVLQPSTHLKNALSGVDVKVFQDSASSGQAEAEPNCDYLLCIGRSSNALHSLAMMNLLDPLETYFAPESRLTVPQRIQGFKDNVTTGEDSAHGKSKGMSNCHDMMCLMAQSLLWDLITVQNQLLRNKAEKEGLGGSIASSEGGDMGSN